MPLAKLNWLQGPGQPPQDNGPEPETQAGAEDTYFSNEMIPWSHQAQSMSSAMEAVVDPIEDLKSKIHRRLIDEIEITQLSKDNPQQLRLQIKNAVMHLIATEEYLLSTSEQERLIQDLLNETLGYGPLEPLLRDKTISDILINGPYQVVVERFGILETTNVRFKDAAHLMQVIDRIVTAVGRRVDESQPVCDARLRDGSRFHCVLPPLAIDGPLVSIRKFATTPFTITDLIRFGTLDVHSANLLKAFVQARLNVVISGGTGSGKTTLLNVLSSFIPANERIVTIEDAAEIQLQQPHVARMETRPANLEGQGEITQRELFRNALRMRPDRVIVGECRAGECLDMLQAMNTGHDGSLTTLHANNPRDAIRRMETMVLMAGYDLPSRAIREQIASAIDVIIQTTRLSDGSRKITNISEVVGMEGEIILLQDVFRFQQTGLDENRRVVGEFKYEGVRPKFLEMLLSTGAEVDLSYFEM